MIWLFGWSGRKPLKPVPTHFNSSIYLISQTSSNCFSTTGSSLNIVFFSTDSKIFRTLAFLCFPSVSVCVYTCRAGRTSALQQNWQGLEKSQNFKETTQHLMNTLYLAIHQYVCQSYRPAEVWRRSAGCSGSVATGPWSPAVSLYRASTTLVRCAQ